MKKRYRKPFLDNEYGIRVHPFTELSYALLKGLFLLLKKLFNKAIRRG